MIKTRRDVWDVRAERWMVINAFNHAIYAILFLIRSFFYAGVSDGDRPFYFESYLLEALLPPPLCAALGWAGPPDRLQILAFVKSCNADAEAGLATYGWPIGAAVSNHTFMYFYQIVEGIFHLMLVVGSLWLLFPATPSKSPRAWRFLTLYKLGLWLEIIWMDIPYTYAYTLVALRRSVPGFPGLAVLMMVLHHLTVLPDIVSAYLEWRASEPKRKFT